MPEQIQYMTFTYINYKLTDARDATFQTHYQKTFHIYHGFKCTVFNYISDTT